MTTKRTTTRFGDAPVPPGSPQRGAPLPLLTQPMSPLDPVSAAALLDAQEATSNQTRVDNPMTGNATSAAAQALFASGNARPTEQMGAVISRTTTAISAAAPAVARHVVPSQMPGQAPPEIGLTQHHLPDEAPDPRLALVIDPDSERSAAFRVLRHHLLEIGRPQVVAVSSAGAGDGKTTTAVNLALALSECGRAKVLLVETHVRRPQLAGLFKFVPPWCFAEQLAAHRHQPMLPWSLIEIPSLWLHVAAINPRIEQTQLLDGPAFTIAMDRLRLGGYDHIVVDCPPVLGSADANLMADAVDGVVMAVHARRTTARDLRRAVDQLGANKISGTVLVQ